MDLLSGCSSEELNEEIVSLASATGGVGVSQPGFRLRLGRSKYGTGTVSFVFPALEPGSIPAHAGFDCSTSNGRASVVG